MRSAARSTQSPSCGQPGTGSAAAGETIPTDDSVTLDEFATGRLAPAWALADQLVQRLRGFGDVYVTIVVAGGRFPRRKGHRLHRHADVAHSFPGWTMVKSPASGESSSVRLAIPKRSRDPGRTRVASRRDRDPHVRAGTARRV